MTMIQAGPRTIWAVMSASLLLMSGGNRGTGTAAGTGERAPAAEARTRPAAVPATSGSAVSAGDGRPVIACFGDSLTAGYGVGADESYPSRLQQDLDDAGYRYRVVNMGVSGETTKDGLARVDRVIALKPAIAVVEFGGNDGLRGLPVSASRANLDGIVMKLQSSGIKVTLAGITLPPQFGGAYVQQFNQTYTLVAHKHHVPLYPFLLQEVYGVGGSMQQDGIHPTAQGCKQVARNVLGFIRPLLKK